MDRFKFMPQTTIATNGWPPVYNFRHFRIFFFQRIARKICFCPHIHAEDFRAFGIWWVLGCADVVKLIACALFFFDKIVIEEYFIIGVGLVPLTLGNCSPLVMNQFTA